MKPHKARTIQRKSRFCWHKRVDSGLIVYRLFRRADTTGQVRIEAVTFRPVDHRNGIPHALRDARRTLRDAVDHVDLTNLGVL